MSFWNYRITRERVSDDPLVGQYLYAIREVYYDDDGKVTAWSTEPTAATGDTAMECADAAALMAGCAARGVLDLETRQTLLRFRS